METQVWEGGYARGFSAELSEDPATRHTVVSRPKDADLIILMESNLHKRAQSIRGYLSEPVLLEHCSKVCCINYEDSPAGFLRGLYTSLEGGKFDPTLHKSWPAIFLPNEEIYKLTNEQIWNCRPIYRFTFVGSRSHPLRGELIRRFSNPAGKYKVLEAKSWYNHGPAELLSYVRDSLLSEFILCPRGHAGYTHRIAEAMALGRVPVIIADDWIPFSIPETDYFIRLPESKLDDLEDFLDEKQPEAATLGRRAREVWLKHFSRQGRAAAAVEAAVDLLTKRTASLSMPEYHRRWRSYHFQQLNQMTLWQRAWRRCRGALRRIGIKT